MAAWLLASKAHELARAKGPSEIAALHCFALVSIGRLDEAGAVIRAEIQLADGSLRAGLVAQESALMPQAERLRDPDSLRAGISQLEEQLVRDSRLNAEKSAGLLAALEPRIARLHEACSARRTWRFADASSQWWHDQLAEAELALSDLGDQVRIARESLHSPKAQARWMEALQEIPKLPSYSGSELLRAGRFTPQPGLLPLGVNPRSGLWEFVHLETGAEPACDADGRVVRDAEGRLSLSAETGVVFILVPGGKLPLEVPPPGQLIRQDMDASAVELAPYFLSKYEMTQFQWDRCANDPYTIVHPNDALLPAASLSWPAARATLSKLLGSPTLPSHVQWELACRGGTTTYWWTGAEPASLVGRENVRVQGEQAAPCRAIGTGEPNPFGFHDMHGNVWEWTHDALLVDYERPVLVHAKGDGVLDRPGAAFRKIAGGSSAYDADQARSSFTTAVTAGHAVGDLGLRPAMRIARAEH
jgi:formylglycine-generating enzyme required for sulfatase activity